MARDERSAGLRLLETGTLVEFRVVGEEVTPGPDEGEFAVQIELLLCSDEEDDPADLVEWGAFGFTFTLGLLSFADARPRGFSAQEYSEEDELSVADFIDRVSYRRGNLHFYADYIRGRRLKTTVVVRPDGSVTLSTVGRGKAAFRWLDRLQGKKNLQAVRK